MIFLSTSNHHIPALKWICSIIRNCSHSYPQLVCHHAVGSLMLPECFITMWPCSDHKAGVWIVCILAGALKPIKNLLLSRVLFSFCHLWALLAAWEPNHCLLPSVRSRKLFQEVNPIIDYWGSSALCSTLHSWFCYLMDIMNPFFLFSYSTFLTSTLPKALYILMWGQ